MFSPFEARLSHVYRWPISRTIQRQSVAEHSFRVALWADRIAKKYYGISGNASILYHITRTALLHDQMEAFTGDAPSTVKPIDWDNEVYGRFHAKIIEHCNHNDELVNNIIKVADLCEAIVFLNEEAAMGNNSIEGLTAYCRLKLRRVIADRPDATKMWSDLMLDCEHAAAFKQEALDD